MKSFIVEVYKDNFIKDQFHVEGVDSVLNKIKQLNSEYNYKLNSYNDLANYFPVQYMIIDKSMSRKPDIINNPSDLYAWYLSYSDSQQSTNTQTTLFNNQPSRNTYIPKEYKEDSPLKSIAGDFGAVIGIGIIMFVILLIIMGLINLFS